MLLQGAVVLDTIDGTQDFGTPLFLDTTDGDANVAAPSDAGDIKRYIGHALLPSAAGKMIYFNPDVYFEVIS